MICNLFKAFKKHRQKGKFFEGQTFHYKDSVLMIVDKRVSKHVGFEYMVLLDGEVHGGLTESVMEQLNAINI